MRKSIYSLVLMFAITAFATSAMAVTTITGQTVLGSGANSFTPSAKVGLKVLSSATSYAATACHLNGTTQYGTVGGSGTTQDASKIYTKPIPTQQSTNTAGVPDDPTSPTDIGTGWN
jgi:hypothetical protein